MGTFGGPDIVEDGLKFAYDAGSIRSYPGSGSTVNDIVGTVNGTLTNNASYSSSNGGVFDLDGTDDCIDTLSLVGTDIEFLSNPQNNTNLTYSIWSYNESSTSYYLFSTGAQTSSTGVALSYQAGAGFLTLKTPTKTHFENIPTYWPLNEWVQFTYVKTSSNTFFFYRNGVLIVNGNITGNVTSTDLETILKIGGPNNSTCCRFDGKIGGILVYNQALTAAQVLQNYNAQKNRYI